MIDSGISPEYFLDEMSFDEISAVLKRRIKNDQEQWERQRMDWIFILRSQGADITDPRQVYRFGWEEPVTKSRKPLTKEQVKKKEIQAKRWLDKGKLM
jgi:hypothetical protein